MVKCTRWTQPSAPPAILNGPTPVAGLLEAPFPFLSLPRELRDQIYIHALPHTLKYCQPTSYAISIWHGPPLPLKPLSHLSLFLACHQLHDEASETLWRTCAIALPSVNSYHRKLRFRTKRYQHDERLPLHLTLSSFPSAAADLVTRVTKEYGDCPDLYRDGRTLKQQTDSDECFAMWSHIVSESLIFQKYFPRLRRFDVEWYAFQRQVTERWWCQVDGLDPLWRESEKCAKVEHIACILVSWLQSWGEGKACVPPALLNIRFDWLKQVRETDKSGMKILEDALALAHRLFAKETLSRDERDESGRMWLEGLSAKRDRKRKGWCDAVGIV